MNTPLEENYTGFVYLWYDTKRKMYYVGSHFGTLEDGYVGSNQRLMRAYNKRPETFKRKILHFHYNDDRKELYEAEERFLNMIKPGELSHPGNDNPRYYNVKAKASGLDSETASILKQSWWDDPEKSDAWRAELSKRMSEDNPEARRKAAGIVRVGWNKGQKCPQISAALKGRPFTGDREAMARHTKALWDAGVFDNRPPPTAEHEAKRQATRAERAKTIEGYGVSDKQKEAARAANLGKKASEETKEKLRAIARERENVVKVCPHCGHVGSGPVMKRWHFTNCRHIATD